MSGGGQELPPGWENPPLARVARINPALNCCVVGESTEVNFVPMRAVEGEGGGLIRPEVRPYAKVKRGYRSFLPGDVIMAKITPCMENGKTAVVPELPGRVCFGSTEFHVIRPEEGVQPRWIARFLLQNEIRRAAQRQMTGGVGQMRVPAAFLEDLSLPLAPSLEQSRIADLVDELLSDVDAGVAAVERVRERLQIYRASVLKAAVEGVLTAEWRAKHSQPEPASELLKRILAERRRRWEEEQSRRFKEMGREPPRNWKAKYKEPSAPDTANLPPLPKGWCWANSEQVCGFITKGTTPPGADAPRSKGDVPFIKVQHLSGNGAFWFSDSPSFVSKGSHHGFLARSKVFPDDVLMNIVGPPLGQVSIVPPTFPEWNVNQAIAIFRTVRGLSHKFLAACLLSRPVLTQALRRTKTTAGQVNLTLEVCRDLAIPLPPVAEQEAIIEAIEDQVSVIEHLEAGFESELKGAQALRQAILRHAFAGRLVTQDSCDEPASELLKRIAAKRAERTREGAATRLFSRKAGMAHAGRRGRPKKNEVKAN